MCHVFYRRRHVIWVVIGKTRKIDIIISIILKKNIIVVDLLIFLLLFRLLESITDTPLLLLALVICKKTAYSSILI